MSEWKELKKEIEVTLNEEKENLEYYWAPGTEGWVEALEYVLGRMNFYENKNEEE